MIFGLDSRQTAQESEQKERVGIVKGLDRQSKSEMRSDTSGILRLLYTSSRRVRAP